MSLLSSLDEGSRVFRVLLAASCGTRRLFVSFRSRPEETQEQLPYHFRTSAQHSTTQHTRAQRCALDRLPPPPPASAQPQIQRTAASQARSCHRAHRFKSAKRRSAHQWARFLKTDQNLHSPSVSTGMGCHDCIVSRKAVILRWIEQFVSSSLLKKSSNINIRQWDTYYKLIL